MGKERKMTREQMESMLALAGWEPKRCTLTNRCTLFRGRERFYWGEFVGQWKYLETSGDTDHQTAAEWKDIDAGAIAAAWRNEYDTRTD